MISTRGCDPRGGPKACVITAHDARTGKELWRFNNPRPPASPAARAGGTCPTRPAARRGLDDPELGSRDPNLVYIGTSVTSPAPKFALDGNDKQYLYHNSTLAIDATTGKLSWYYQHVVDHWDLDHTMERMMVDEAVARTPRKWAGSTRA